MNFPIPVFFISFVLFILFFSFRRNRQTKSQEDANEAFLERERLANTTRKKDISNLDYLPFVITDVPLSSHSDDKLAKQTAVLQELSGKKIINLSAYSNTDLKLMYGPANLNDLTEYDDNYHMLAAALLDYAQRASELEEYDAAIAILEYAMRLKIDSSRIYLLLAKLYQKQQTPEKIRAIEDALSQMEESFASHVLPKLTAFHNGK